LLKGTPRAVPDTHSAAAGCGRRSIRSATSHALRKLPRLQTAVSFRRPGSASPPTVRDLPGGASWWSQRTTHRGSAQQTSRRHVGSRPMQTALTGGRRSNARRYPRVPATCASSSRRRVCRRSTAPRTIWEQHWHVFCRPILRPRLKQPWHTYGSPLHWWKRRARHPNRLHLC
jgi:hypothetical protein